MLSRQTEFLLQLNLDTAVPLWVEAFRDYSFDEHKRVLRECEEVFAECGEAIFHHVKGKTGKMFNAVAKTIAVLSFAPGGIDAFDRHWENKRSG